MGQPVSAGSAYGLRPTLAWPVTWPAPLKSRYVTWGALQVLCLCLCLCLCLSLFVTGGRLNWPPVLSTVRRTLICLVLFDLMWDISIHTADKTCDASIHNKYVTETKHSKQSHWNYKLELRKPLIVFLKESGLQPVVHFWAVFYRVRQWNNCNYLVCKSSIVWLVSIVVWARDPRTVSGLALTVEYWYNSGRRMTLRGTKATKTSRFIHLYELKCPRQGESIFAYGPMDFIYLKSKPYTKYIKQTMKTTEKNNRKWMKTL